MHDVTFKICIFGDGGVGKTTLLRRYVSGEFILDTKVTVGVDIAVKEVEIEGSLIRLQIWDFGGEERFRFLLPAYGRGSSGGIFMFDITRLSTLDNVDEWLEVFRKEQLGTFKAPLVIVGGKSDLIEEKQIFHKEGLKIARKHKFAHYFECSSLTGDNVILIFETLVREIMKSKGFI